MITAIVRSGSAITKASKLIPRSAAASKPVLASKSVKLAPSYPKVDAPKKGNGLVKKLPDALDFASSFASAFSDPSGTDTPKQKVKTKNCCDTLVPLVDSISKKLVDIDKLLKDELKLDRKNSDYKRKKKEKEQYKKQEEKLETPKKVKPKAKLSPGAPGISLGERIKRFVMFTLLGWLVDKILPLLPKLTPIFNAVGKVINFGTELFGGLVSGLSKFLEFGIKLTNGLTKSLGFISGARTEQEFSDFEKKFNRMVDLSILAAMLIGDSGSDLFDGFGRGKGRGKGGKPSTSKPRPGTGGRSKVTTSGGKSASRFGRIKERFTEPFRQKSKVTTSGGRETGLGGRLKDLKDKVTRPTTKVTTSGGKTTGILGKIEDLGTKLKKTISPTKITGAPAKPSLLKGATEGTQKLLGAAKQSKVISGAKNVLSKVKVPPAVGRAAGPVGTVLFAGLEFAGRKESGQTTTQAAIGTGASVAGGLAGAAGGAQAGAAIGAAIGLPFAGVGAVPGAAIGGIIGGILGGLGGSWAASSIADTATGANKPKVEKHDTGGIVKNTFNLDNFIQNNQSTTKSSLPKWFESANKNKVSTKSSIKINLPKKKKAQSEKPGKDIGGYGEITKLFPDPEGKVSGTGSSQGGAAITSAAQKKAGFNIFNPFSWFSKSTSGPAATTPAAQPPQGSSQPNALFALTKASQSLKKIPFVGYLMGAAVDIAMGQKPDRDLYQTMADSVLYLGQKAAEGQSKEIQTNIQKLAAGGITSIAESSSPISLDAGKVANKTLRDSLAGAIEIGANGALKNVKDEIISADVRGRNSSARTGYDPRYDQPPGTETESGPGGAPPPAPSGGGTTGGISGSGIGKGVSIAKKLMVDLNIKPAAAAGIVGNLMHESSLKPDNVENGKGFEDGAINNIPKGTQRVGYGWGQWTNDRLETFRSFLKGRKADNRPATDDDNYAYLIKELKSSEPIRGHWKGWGGKNIPEEDPKRAATWFMMNWERPSAPHEDSRHDYAVKIFDQIKNVSKDQAKADVQKSGGKIASEQEYTDGSDPRSKDDKKGGSKIGGKSIVDIGKNLISQKFSVAEHPDFSKNPSPSGGSYTPGKGVVSNVHKGRGHYEGRAIDVTDWTSGYPGRYNKVADALQKNSAIKMLIHDKWGFYKDGQKSGPGSYGHPTHLHVETKFHGGLVDKEGLVKIHKNEFVVDADTVKLFGVDFFKSLNSVENKVNLSKVAPDLISRISESIKGSSFTLPQTDQYTKEEDPKSASQNKDSTQITTQNLDKFNKEQETKTEESQQNEKDDKKQTVQVIPANHPETGKGFTIRGVTDGNGRPLILSKGAITAFGEMMQDSKGVVKGSDVASGKRSPAQNKKVGGVKNSNHLGGNALDIHGTSMPWMRKKGKAYGWVVNDYPGSHGGHFDYKGDTKDSEGDTLAAMSSDSIMDSVTDYGNAPSGAGPSGGGESAGGSLGGSNDNANPQQDVDVEPTEELIERKGGGVPKGFKPGAAGSFTTDKGQIDHQSIQRFIMNNEGSIKDSQGRHTRYKDSNGFWTIGFGHLWKEGDPMTMSQEEAEKLFQKDYTSHRKAAESIPGFAKASAAQQAALIDLTFNMGPGWYKEWPSFTKAMKEGKYEKAQAELKDSAWFKQVGVRAPKVIDLIGRSGVPGGPPTKSGEEPPSGDPNKPNSINIGNYTIDTKNDFLKAAGTGKLKYGEGGDGWCTTNVLKGLDKLGHTFAPGGTEGDSSNPRGLVSQLIGDSGFTSIPGLGSEQTIKSPYGNVKARVVPFKDYQAAVEKGLIPSGAFLFSTRYKSWNQQTGGSSGFDTAIAREGGRIAWNGTGSKGNAIYGDATQSVIVLVPRSAIKEKPTQKPGGPAKPGTSAKPGAPAKPGGKPKQNWLQSAASNAVGLLTGKKKLGILKAEGGGQIDSSGIITRPKMRNIESFASYEDPSSSSTHIIIVPSPAKQLPPEKTRGLSGYSSNPSKSSNKYYSPARRK